MKKYFFIVVAAMIAVNVSSQEKEIELDPITVTASLIPVSSSKTGRNIIVIKGEQINRLPVNSIDELIRYLPGVEVQSRGPMGTQSNITIRGGTFQQVLVILDGVRLNDPLTGHFNSYIPISPAEIDRIEILKGASSAVYGSEAVGGVVNIISKTFTAKKGRSEQKINAQIIGGDYGLRNAQAGFSWQKNKTAIAGGLIQNVADGQPLRGTNGFFNLTTVSISAKQYFTEHLSIAYRGAYDDRHFNAQNFYTNFLSDTATESVITRWHQFNLSFQKKKHVLNVDAAAKYASDTYQFRKGSAANTNRSTVFQLQAKDQIQVNDRLAITTGAQIVKRAVKSNNRGDHGITSTGIFFLLNHQLGAHLFLNPAIRADWNERAGWELIPQLNVSYRIPELQIRASVGKSTRDADFTERFNNYLPASVAAGSRIGNPDLYAETSFNYEAGLDYFIHQNFKVSAGWFQRFHQGLIDYSPTPYANMPRQVNLVSGGIYSLAKNIDKVNTRGVETDIQFIQTINEKQRLTISVGAIWMKSTSSDTVPSLYVSNHAKLFSNFSLQYKLQNLNVSVNGLYKQRNAQVGNPAFVPLSKDYFVLNTRIEGRFLQNKLGLFIQIDNLLNQQYTDILGTSMPKRWVMGGIQLNL